MESWKVYFLSCHYSAAANSLRLDSFQFQAHIPAGWRPKTRLFTLYCSVEFFSIITLHGPHEKHRLLLSHNVLGVFTAPLHSNGRGADHIENNLSIIEACLPSPCLAMVMHVTIITQDVSSANLPTQCMTFPGSYSRCTLRITITWRSSIRIYFESIRSDWAVNGKNKCRPICAVPSINKQTVTALLETIDNLVINWEWFIFLSCDNSQRFSEKLTSAFR
jgi:hypothetical protein